MIRALVHSLVLIVAIGPTAATICRTACDGQAGTVACIHEHRQAAPRVSSGAVCSDIGIGFTAFVKDDVRRGASASHEDVLMAVPEVLVRPLMAAPHVAAQPCHGGSFDSRPLSAALRI
jgi:hypothetical protein